MNALTATENRAVPGNQIQMGGPYISRLNAANYKVSTGTEKFQTGWRSHTTLSLIISATKMYETMATRYSLFFSYHQANGQSMEKY